MKISKDKKKWVKNRDVYLNGLPLHYPITVQMDYQKDLRKLIVPMMKDVKKQIIKLFKPYLSTMDESITSQAKRLLGKLSKKYEKIINENSKIIAKIMVDKEKNASARSLKSSFKKLTGNISLKTNYISKDLKPKIDSLIAENVSLIKSIPEEYFTNITGTVMRSITTGKGLDSLTKALTKYEGITERKAKNIAIDQTRKAYNVINKERMESAGFTKFKWLHSGGGLQPRKDHIAMNGKVYSFDKLPVIDKKTGERGIPGQAINCGCTMMPVYEFPKGEK